MSYDQILVERKSRVGIITLNRPEKLNPWSYHMAGEIRDAVESFNNDETIGAVVMTGAGRAFCAGADIRGWDEQIAESEAAAPAPRLTRRASSTSSPVRSRSSAPSTAHRSAWASP
jgi:enoyl-CoA hydratase/carnithine racemase